jgi:hypothetical protein
MSSARFSRLLASSSSRASADDRSGPRLGVLSSRTIVMRCLVLLAALFALRAFAAQGYQVQLKLTIDGSAVEPMTVTLAEGAAATVGLVGDRRIAIDVNVKSAGRDAKGAEQVQIGARITEQKAGRTIVHGDPTVVVALDTAASVAVGDATGESGYRLELIASRAP